ncbi:Uncharacterised protein [Mycobacteroides abscessus subsp. abscessus]|nr:Uncharacterised protein [Mycobacteroides abscessus subsp. abscessus]
MIPCYIQQVVLMLEQVQIRFSSVLVKLYQVLLWQQI